LSTENQTKIEWEKRENDTIFYLFADVNNNKWIYDVSCYGIAASKVLFTRSIKAAPPSLVNYRLHLRGVISSSMPLP